MPDYKAQFALASDMELTFRDRDGNPIGNLKIKPSTILWKAKGNQLYRSVGIEQLTAWIEENGTKVKF